MKAFVNPKYGGPEVLELRHVPKPVPTDHEVLVKVKAASINSWDWDYLRGDIYIFRLIFGLFKPKHPILGSDISGTVEAIGKNVKRIKIGDEVYGDVSAYNWGGFAEYAASHENAWALKPKNLSFEEAAAIPQAAVLALQALRWNGDLKAGQKVLINGAGGGVGTFGIQIAKLAGVEVTVVDGPEKLQSLIDLGADHVIDYTKEDFSRLGKKYDLIIDNVARRTTSDYQRALNNGGAFVMVGGSLLLMMKVALFGKWISKRGKRIVGILAHKPNVEDLNYLATLTETGKLKPIVDSIYPLEELPEAFRHYANGPFIGKVVIRGND